MDSMPGADPGATAADGYPGAMLLLSLMTLPLLAAPTGPIPAQEPEASRHPDFELPLVGGGMGKLSDYRGSKLVVIHFASW